MSRKEQASSNLLSALRDGRNAIIGRGGNISPVAGFKDFPSAIYNIPADSAIGTVDATVIAKSQPVPANSTSFAYIAEFGGMTYRDEETNTLRNAKPTEIVSEGANLVKYPFDFRSYTHNGVTFTANDDQTITISGTPTANTNVDVLRATPIRAKAGETFTLSTSGDWTGKNGYVSVSQRVNGATIASGSASTTPKTFTVAQDCDLTLGIVVIKDYTYDGSVTIMLNRGSTAAPNKPYVGTISTRAIPEEILNLPGFGEGISIDYYNKVDLVNNKYKKYIVTKTLNNPSDWRSGTIEGQNMNYYACKLGDRGVYATRVCVSDKFERVHISSSTTEVGIDVFDSSAFGGFMVAIRPENVQDCTIDTFKKWIKENPVTVKYSLLVPIETDLPVKMRPLIAVEGGGTVVTKSDNGLAVPSKIIYQTKTSEGV